MPLAERSPPAAALVSVLRAWGHSLGSFDSDLVAMRANALTYRTLLAVVPLLAVAFSLFQAFGGLDAGEQALRQMLVRNLGPGAAEAAVRQLGGFVDRVSRGAVAGTGVVFLVFTVISLLSSIEVSMNALWRIERGRSFLDRFVVYWATITVGPLLLAVSLSMTTAAQSGALAAWLSAAAPAAELLFRFGPWLFSCLSLTLLYLIVPNTHVHWRAAFSGGLFAGTLWEIAKRVFTWASGSLLRYDAVYGSFGTLPAFLLWLQVGWIIILLGCKMSYVLQHGRAIREQRLQASVSPAGRELLALAFVTRIARAFAAGEPAPTLSDLLAGTRGAINAGQEVLRRLEAAKLVVAVPSGERDGAEQNDEAYVPGREPAAITVRQVLDAFRREGASPGELATGEAAIQRARELLHRRDVASGPIEGTTIAELVQAIGPRSAPYPFPVSPP
jgi:membrane protein